MRSNVRSGLFVLVLAGGVMFGVAIAAASGSSGQFKDLLNKAKQAAQSRTGNARVAHAGSGATFSLRRAVRRSSRWIWLLHKHQPLADRLRHPCWRRSCRIWLRDA